MKRRELIRGIAAAAVATAALPAAVEAFSTDSMRYIAWERVGQWCWRPEGDDILLRPVRYDVGPYRLSRAALKEHASTVYDVIEMLHEHERRLRDMISESLYGPQFVVWEGPSRRHWGRDAGLSGMADALEDTTVKARDALRVLVDAGLYSSDPNGLKPRRA